VVGAAETAVGDGTVAVVAVVVVGATFVVVVVVVAAVAVAVAVVVVNTSGLVFDLDDSLTVGEGLAWNNKETALIMLP
jgi:hypothetical protein